MKNYVQINPTVKSKPALLKVSTLTKINPFQSPKTPILSPKVNTKPLGKAANNTSTTVGLKVCRSVKQMAARGQGESEELAQINMLGLDEGEELFVDSSSKMKGRPMSSYQSIEEELAQVLELIRVEKAQIEQQIKILKRKHEDYKRICEGKQVEKVECGVNTQSREEEQAVVKVERGVDCDLLQSRKVQERDESEQRVHEVYLKLCKLLQEMSIDAKKVLPQEHVMRAQVRIEDYQVLTEKRLIEIQKYFIYKILLRSRK